MANLEHDLPNTPESIFEAGSGSKQRTAAAVVLLALDGAFSLDNDIHAYVPEVPDYGGSCPVAPLRIPVRGDGHEINQPIEHIHGNSALLTTVDDLLAWTRNLETGTAGGPETTYAAGLRIGTSLRDRPHRWRHRRDEPPLTWAGAAGPGREARACWSRRVR